jgi:hypothetical protein
MHVHLCTLFVLPKTNPKISIYLLLLLYIHILLEKMQFVLESIFRTIFFPENEASFYIAPRGNFYPRGEVVPRG